MTDTRAEDYDFRYWLKPGGLYYLACPFTGNIDQQEQRTLEIAKLACDLYTSGYEIFSPITHSKMIAEAFNQPTTWEFWKRLDLTLLSRCDGLLVVPMSGWQQSVGMQAEAAYAFRNDMPVSMIMLDDMYDDSSKWEHGVLVHHLNSSFLNEFQLSDKEKGEI